MLLLGSNPGIDWLGVSVVAGNAPVDITYDNALRIKAHDGLQVPIYRGCEEPLAGVIETAQRILGDSGMRRREKFCRPARPRMLPATPSTR